jgi:hypothetical protein
VPADSVCSALSARNVPSSDVAMSGVKNILHTRVLSVPLAELNPFRTPVLSCSRCMKAAIVYKLVQVWRCALAWLQLHGTSGRLVLLRPLGVTVMGWHGMGRQQGSVCQFVEAPGPMCVPFRLYGC